MILRGLHTYSYEYVVVVVIIIIYFFAVVIRRRFIFDFEETNETRATS